jgi:hypothetical protein
MIFLFSFLSIAMAADPVYVPAGDSVTAAAPSYLLSESMFDKCLADSRALSELALPGIERCQSVCSSALTTAQNALTTCRAQLDLDSDQIADLTGHVAGLEAGNIKLKHQRNIAWAIAGSLVVGSVSAIFVTTQVP